MPRRRTPRDAASLEANRRAELLRVAARLFIARGFDATTTRDIAQAVGMRSGSPFYHFRSKRELLEAAITDGLETGHRRLQQACAGISDPALRLRAMVRAHLGNLLEGECQAPLLLYESRALDAAARARIADSAQRYQAPWQEVLDQLAATGQLASSAPPLRLLLFGMLNWTPQWYRPEGALSPEEIGAAIVGLLLGQAPAPADT